MSPFSIYRQSLGEAKSSYSASQKRSLPRLLDPSTHCRILDVGLRARRKRGFPLGTRSMAAAEVEVKVECAAEVAEKKSAMAGARSFWSQLFLRPWAGDGTKKACHA